MSHIRTIHNCGDLNTNHGKIWRRLGWMLALICSLTATSSAFSQAVSDQITITAPASGSILAPGQALQVSVTIAPGSTFNAVQVIGEDIGITPPITTPPYAFNLTIPNNIIGPKKLTAVGIARSGSVVFSQSIVVDIETAAAMTRLDVSPPRISFGFAGAQVGLTATGRFTGGSMLDITDSSKLTYASNKISIATVDSHGVVTAVGAGTAEITVKYGNVSFVVPISVPAAIEGDLNRDGVVNQDDLNLLFDSFNESASGTFDERDLNHDGIIDWSDIEQLASLCTVSCNVKVLDHTPPTLSVTANPAILWPPNHKTIMVTISGNITDDVSGVDTGSAKFSVSDEYDSFNFGGSVAVGSDGNYSFSIPLQAARNGNDKDGRRYTITLEAQDRAGNTGSGSTQVVVPHDQGQRQS